MNLDINHLKLKIMWIAHLNLTIDCTPIDKKPVTAKTIVRKESFQRTQYLWYNDGTFCYRYSESKIIKFGIRKGQIYSKVYSEYYKINNEYNPKKQHEINVFKEALRVYNVENEKIAWGYEMDAAIGCSEFVTSISRYDVEAALFVLEKYGYTLDDWKVWLKERESKFPNDLLQNNAPEQDILYSIYYYEIEQKEEVEN